jgi:stage II sporulation protein R
MLAQRTIEENGYRYPVRAELANTIFPTREYEDFRLPAGSYLALRVVIGEGAGKNWWCVVFPPLCAQSTTDLAQTAMAAGLAEEDIRLIEETDGGYLLKFKSIEFWEWIRQKLF